MGTTARLWRQSLQPTTSVMNQWYYKSSGYIIGPLKSEALICALESRDAAEVLVRQGEQGDWQPAIELAPRLAADAATARVADTDDDDPEINEPLETPQKLSVSVAVAVGVVVPVILTLADHGLFTVGEWLRWEVSAVVVVFAAFVVQIAVFSFLVGRLLHPRWLRVLVFLWGLTLVNLIVFRVAAEQSMHPWRNPATVLAISLVSGQVGLLIVWSVLGKSYWPIRIAALLLGLVVAQSVCQSFGHAGRNSGNLLTAQILATLAIAGLMYWARFRLDRPRRTSRADDHEIDDRLGTFSLMQLFRWMTGLAVAAALFRLFDLSGLASPRWFGIIGTGCGLAIVSVVAFWGALGREGLPVRAGVVLTVPAVFGLTLDFFWPNAVGGFATGGLVWLPWMFLAAGFLAGALMVLRGDGICLVRLPRKALS